MDGFINFFLHFFFITTFTVLIVISFLILRPFRVHRTRMYSTIALKMSYLLYLIVFILLVYLVLFYSDIPASEEPWADQLVMKLSYAIILISFFVPNIAIMLRRKVKKFRHEYNIFFTIMNILISLALAFTIRFFPIRI